TSLPPLLRAEPALAALAGSSAAVVAVPEPARAITIAGLAHLSGRHPLVVAVPTSTEADRVAHDLRVFLGADEVDVFPAWETLPFERVSPSVDTMGRRLRAMWRLRDPERMPRVLLASVRALVQRLGPHVEEAEPILVRPGDVRERANRLIAREPWGREQWERLAEGATFDGMESWLPWLTEGEHALFDLLGPEAQVLLMEPRRMRDRAAEVLAEEADLAQSLAQTWGAP